jgi:uncharacterized protein YcbK (DUF882 family)
MKYAFQNSFSKLLRKSCSRRFFIKASVAGVLSLFCNPVFASPIPSGVPEGRLSLINAHTEERLNITYRDSLGNYILESLNNLDHFFRCHYTGQVKEMDIATIESLNLIDKMSGGNRNIHIISGYRSPEYNNLLRREGKGAVKNSLHLQGKAIDFSIPGVSLHKIRDIALSLGRGGVGYYPESDFVHIDSGKLRRW